jgi:hypothetical protein
MRNHGPPAVLKQKSSARMLRFLKKTEKLPHGCRRQPMIAAAHLVNARCANDQIGSAE